MYTSNDLNSALQDIHHCLTQFQKFGFEFEVRSLISPQDHTITDHLMSTLLMIVNQLPLVSQAYTGKTRLWTKVDPSQYVEKTDVTNKTTPLSFNATIIPLGTSCLGTLRFSNTKPSSHSESSLYEYIEKLEYITIDKSQGYCKYLAHGKPIAYELDDGSWIIYNIAEVYRHALHSVCPNGFVLETAETIRVYAEKVTRTLIKELLLESWCQINYRGSIIYA